MSSGFVRGSVSMYDIDCILIVWEGSELLLDYVMLDVSRVLRSNMSGPITVQIRMKYNNLILAGHQQPSKALRFLMWSPT